MKIKGERILLGHGSGGKLAHELIKKYFLKEFKNPTLAKLDDSGVFKKNGLKIALTTDSYVVNPEGLGYPGGDF